MIEKRCFRYLSRHREHLLSHETQDFMLQRNIGDLKMTIANLTSAMDRFATIVVYAALLAALPVATVLFVTPSL